MKHTVLASVAITVMSVTAPACGASVAQRHGSASSLTVAQARRCLDLLKLTAASGPFTIASAELRMGGETPQRRKEITDSVDDMVRIGSNLPYAFPKNIDDSLHKIVYAAAQSKQFLATGMLALKAIAPLNTDDVYAAQQVIAGYKCA